MNRPRVWYFVTALLCTTAAPPVHSQPASPPDEERTVGRPVPAVELIDDRGTVFTLDSLAGRPVVLSPIFTRCPHACQMITSGLRDALLAVGAPGEDYHVVTLSFDPADSLAVLRDYRDAMNLPEGWIVARARPAMLDSLLDAIDFDYRPVAGGGFAHANVVAVLTPDLRVSSYVHGLIYEEDSVRQALLSAVTPDSLVDSFKPVIAGVAALAVIVTLSVLWGTRRRGPAA